MKGERTEQKREARIKMKFISQMLGRGFRRRLWRSSLESAKVKGFFLGILC